MSSFNFYKKHDRKVVSESDSIIENNSGVDENINTGNNNQSDELTLF